MAAIINANSTGLIYTPDNSGTLQLQTGGTTALTINSSQLVTFANPPAITGAVTLGTSLTTPILTSTGSLTLQSGSTNALVLDTSQNLQFNSGFGSVATAYGCRAWCNLTWNGTTLTIRGSGGVSSVSRISTGVYQINFSTTMPDANYCVVGTSAQYNASAAIPANVLCEYLSASNTFAYKTTTGVQVYNGDNNTDAAEDSFSCNVAIFR